MSPLVLLEELGELIASLTPSQPITSSAGL